MGSAGLDRHDPAVRDRAKSVGRAQQRAHDGAVGVGIAALAHGRHQRSFDLLAPAQATETRSGEQSEPSPCWTKSLPDRVLPQHAQGTVATSSVRA